MKKDQPVRGAKKLPTFVSRAERAFVRVARKVRTSVPNAINSKRIIGHFMLPRSQNLCLAVRL